MPHGPVAARRRRLRRPAGRRHRHRLVGDPGDPVDRRAGRAPHRVPAHRRTSRSRRATHRSTRRSSPPRKADYPGAPRAGPAQPDRRARHDRADELATATDADERERRFRAGWERGTHLRRHVHVRRPARSTRPPTSSPPSSCATASASGSTTPPSPRRCSPAPIRSRRSGCASTPGTSRRSTDLTSRSSTCARRRSSRSRRAALRTTGGHHDVDAIVFATGFDAVDRTAARHRPGRARRRRVADEWADGPRDATSGWRPPGSPTCS